MKRLHPSPSLVISLIALFVALGGTSYAAITTLPANSVGTRQIKNHAVTAGKLNATALAHYLRYGGTLPSGMTETGDWGAANLASGVTTAFVSFPVPLGLPNGLVPSHRIYVVGTKAAHCPGVGHAARGYLCVYEGPRTNADAPNSSDIFNPESGNNSDTTGPNGGFGITLGVGSSTDWEVMGTYAVTAP